MNLFKTSTSNNSYASMGEPPPLDMMNFHLISSGVNSIQSEAKACKRISVTPCQNVGRAYMALVERH